MKLLTIVIALVLGSLCWAAPDNLQQTPAFTPASSPASDNSLAMVKRFSPMYANTGYLPWGVSDGVLNAVDNAEYSIVLVPAGTRGRNIWYCPTHGKVEVAFENYVVPASGREAIIVCDTLFFTSCGNLFVTAWRPVCHRVEQPVLQVCRPVLPEFVPIGPAAPIVGLQLMAVAPAARIQPVQPIAIAVASCTATATAIAIVQAAPRVPLSFGKSGLNGKLPYTVGGPGTLITGSFWRRSGQETKSVSPPPPPPPPGGTCPGSNPPLEPTPGGAGNGNGNPSGPNPGGCPPPFDPHQPSAPGDHGIYGNGNSAEPPVPH